MRRIVFATGNEHKMTEIREILADLDYEVISMKEAGVDIDIKETGETFEENALIKARAIHSILTDDIILADDSGLEVDALDGAPGVYSARFMGEDTPYEIKNAEIIKRVNESGKPRNARFRCVIAAVFPDGSEITKDGVIEGEIARQPDGDNGFGYDPILYYPPLNMTTAAMSQSEKNSISHRSKALNKIKEFL